MFAYCNNSPVINQDPTGRVLVTTLILIGAAVVGAGVSLYTGVKAREVGCGWGEAILHSVMNGMMAFCTVYSLGMTAYGCYQELCYLNGLTPANTIGNQCSEIPISHETPNNPLENITYTEKVEAQKNLEDFHSFPDIVDNYGA